MDEDQKHYPPGAEPETAPEAEPAQPKADEAPQEDPKPVTDAEKPEGKEPEAEKPEDAEPTNLPKKRSIYDDLKERKQAAKDATARAEAAEAKAAELQALLEAKADAATPAEKADADADIQAFAEAEGVTPESLDKLVKLVTSKIPKPKSPEGMTAEELAEWRADRASVKQAAEDNDIRAQSASVKKELGISDDAELQNVMNEVVKLAHTEAFHDKEVEYIVWKNKAALSKLVSPKRPSFEEGSQHGEAGEEAPIAYSGQMTPQQAAKAYNTRSKGSSLEIRRPV